MLELWSARNALGRYFATLARLVVAWRWMLLLLVGILVSVAVMQFDKIRMDNANESFLYDDDPTKALLREFHQTFGNDDFTYVLVKSEDVFANLGLLKSLADDLALHVPYVRDMQYLGNVEQMTGIPGGIKIAPLTGPHMPDSPEDIAEFRRRAMNEPLYVDQFISRDGKVAGILLEFDIYPDGKVDPRKSVAPALYDVLARPDYAELDIYAVGGPILDYELDKLTGEEMARFGLICLLIFAAILAWLGRGVRAVLVPLLLILCSILITFGIIGWLQATLTLLIIMLPVLLLCVGIGDAMHLICELQHQQAHNPKENIARACAMVGAPLLLTTLTTLAGFLAFNATDIKPISEMGNFAAIGVVVAWLLTMLLVPVCYSFRPLTIHKAKKRKPITVATKQDFFTRLLRQVARLNNRYPRRIVMIFCGLSIVAFIGYQRIEIETNSVGFMSQSLSVRQAYDTIDAHMGGSMSLEILFRTADKNGLKDLHALTQLQGLQAFIDDLPLTRKTTSVVDVLKKMNRALHENQPEYYRLPDNSAQAGELLFLYETSGGEQLDKQVSFQYDVARLNVRTQSLSSKDVRTFMAAVDGYVQQHLDPAYRIQYTGTMAWMKVLSDYVAKGQTASFGFAFLAIAMLLMLVLRSFYLGLIAMLPNVFPVLISMGAMGYAGVYLSLPLMIFSPIIIGVAVDDTIHFFMRYRREFDVCQDDSQALENTLISSGRPIVFTTLTLICGFAVFGLSDMHNVAQFGLLAAFAFLWALLADFFFAPALMLWLKPLKRRQPTTDAIASNGVSNG